MPLIPTRTGGSFKKRGALHGVERLNAPIAAQKECEDARVALVMWERAFAAVNGRSADIPDREVDPEYNAKLQAFKVARRNATARRASYATQAIVEDAGGGAVDDVVVGAPSTATPQSRWSRREASFEKSHTPAELVAERPATATPTRAAEESGLEEPTAAVRESTPVRKESHPSHRRSAPPKGGSRHRKPRDDEPGDTSQYRQHQRGVSNGGEASGGEDTAQQSGKLSRRVTRRRRSTAQRPDSDTAAIMARRARVDRLLVGDLSADPVEAQKWAEAHPGDGAQLQMDARAWINDVLGNELVLQTLAQSAGETHDALSALEC
jgi:hypothetical protein